jgi:hypothetical protein
MRKERFVITEEDYVSGSQFGTVLEDADEGDEG